MAERIVVLDAQTIPEQFPLLRPSFEHEWVSYPVTAPADIVARAQDATIIMTNKCKMTAEVLSQLPKVKFIAEMATGFNNIDVAYCREHGIGVANVRGYSTKSVAEHTLTMMLMLSRSMLQTRKLMEEGAWQVSPTFCMLPSPIVDLDGKTLTVIGSGNIGSYIGKLAAAFGMNVLKAEHKGAETVREGYTPFMEAIKAADFISVNCPLNAETADLIAAKELTQLKPSCFIVNNARGGVVNEADLTAAILKGTIAGGAADVVSTEPLPSDHPYVKLLDLPNFILTPHQGWMSDYCLGQLVAQLKENLEAYHKGEKLRRVD